MHDAEDVTAFFDRQAMGYAERHGDPDALLAYRLCVIRELQRGFERGTLLEVGCGPATHLFALASEFESAIGTDASARMIERAELIRAAHPVRARIRLATDPAERLDEVADTSVDTVLCVGALEHMVNREAVIAQAHRVLRPGGILICLTHNGDSLWHRVVAPTLALGTRHLSTDSYLTRQGVRRLLARHGFEHPHFQFWRFVPSGDIPRRIAAGLRLVDPIGRLPGLSMFRGGLAFRTVRLPRDVARADRGDE